MSMSIPGFFVGGGVNCRNDHDIVLSGQVQREGFHELFTVFIIRLLWECDFKFTKQTAIDPSFGSPDFVNNVLVNGSCSHGPAGVIPVYEKVCQNIIRRTMRVFHLAIARIHKIDADAVCKDSRARAVFGIFDFGGKVIHGI
jgi:hypothetical protein